MRHFPESFRLLAPRWRRQAVQLAHVLDGRRQQLVPRRAAQRRPFAQQGVALFVGQVHQGARQLVQVQPQQFTLRPSFYNGLNVVAHPGASQSARLPRHRRHSTYATDSVCESGLFRRVDQGRLAGLPRIYEAARD